MNKEYLQALSQEQESSILKKGSILITAIPGSGKTRTLINKIIFEYDESCIQDIVAITYTRRAADEIKARVIKQLGFLPKNIWIGTIHKFCLDYIIRRYGSYSKTLSKPFTIVSEQDAENIITELKTKYNLMPYEQVDFTLSTSGEPLEVYNRELVEEYYSILLNMRKIDFNYILFEAYQLLLKNYNITHQLSKKIKMVCIDEYQDTQELQYQILGTICSLNHESNIFVVGDPNQAIYTGLGGVVKDISELENIFNKDFIQCYLTECYRSDQKIVNFYNEFSQEKVVIKSLKSYPKPDIQVNLNIEKQSVSKEISKIIRGLLKEGIKENEICILAPQWYFLYDLTNKLKQLLPDVSFDAPGIVPLKKDEDNILYKFCKILLSTYSFQNRGRIKMIVKEIIDQFDTEQHIILQYNEIELLNLIWSDLIYKNEATEFLEFNLNRIFNKLGILNLFKRDILDFIQGTKDRIERYKNIGVENDRMFFERTLRSKQGVVISTIHGVKGEEYGTIIAYGLLEGYIPHFKSIFEKGDSFARQESMNLLFVSCSRAKEKLFLIAENGHKTKRGDEYKKNKDLCNAIEKNKEYLVNQFEDIK